MFSALHNGSPIFILDKSTLQLKVGQVQSVSGMKPILGQNFGGSYTTVDVVASAGGEAITIQNVPSSLSVTTQGNLVVSETREGMTAEVENLQRMSLQVIENVERYKETAARCGELLRELNPQLAKEKAQEEKITQLEASLAEMKAMLSQALNTKRTNHENDTNHGREGR